MTRPDICLATVESVRWDYRDDCPAFDGLDVIEGIAPGHFTRPSLIGLHTSRYAAIARNGVGPPTLAGWLRNAGYHTIGVSYSPQTTPEFCFDTGFDEYLHLDVDDGSGRLSRGSKLRERLGENTAVRWLHRQLNPKSATLDRLPTDGTAVDRAISAFRSANPPRFLWIHFMGSHRPYGWGDNGLPDRLDAKAAAVGSHWRQISLSDAEHETVASAYRQGLERTGDRVQTLRQALPDDCVLAVAGDHGEELGESGYYFHGGYRRRTPTTITRVPVGVRNVDVTGPVGLIDLPAVICESAGFEPAPEWDGRLDSRTWLTLAPWGGRTSLRWHGRSSSFEATGANLTGMSESHVPPNVRKQLTALGYR